MQLFKYEATTYQGRKKAGWAFASNAEALQLRLRNQRTTLTYWRPVGLQQRVTLEQKYELFYELGSLIGAGINLNEALQLLQSEETRLQASIRQWSREVEAGKPLSHCVQNDPAVMTPSIVKMIEVGEATGELAMSLSQIGSYYKDMAELRRKVVTALVYPAIVVLVSLIAVVILTLYVIPMFLHMFERYKVSLPVPTQILIATIHFLETYGWLLALGLLLSVYLIQNARTRHPQLFFRAVHLLPLLGKTLNLMRRLSVARILNHLVVAGVRVHDAADMLQDLFEDPTWNLRLKQANHAILQGASLSEAFAQERVFPSRDLKLIKIGEETGNLSAQLGVISSGYERQLEKTLDRLTALFEPVLIVFLSIFIGFVLVALYLPLFDMLGGRGMRGA